MPPGRPVHVPTASWPFSGSLPHPRLPPLLVSYSSFPLPSNRARPRASVRHKHSFVERSRVHPSQDSSHTRLGYQSPALLLELECCSMLAIVTGVRYNAYSVPFDRPKLRFRWAESGQDPQARLISARDAATDAFNIARDIAADALDAAKGTAADALDTAPEGLKSLSTATSSLSPPRSRHHNSSKTWSLRAKAETGAVLGRVNLLGSQMVKTPQLRLLSPRPCRHLRIPVYPAPTFAKMDLCASPAS